MTNEKQNETFEEKVAYLNEMIHQMDEWECPKLAYGFREELKTLVAMHRFDQGELA